MFRAVVFLSLDIVLSFKEYLAVSGDIFLWIGDITKYSEGTGQSPTTHFIQLRM